MANLIQLSGKNSVAFTIDNLSKAVGFGTHVSTQKNENGYGGENAEFHFVSGTVDKPSDEIVFLCYDGFKDNDLHANEFRVDLGRKEQISFAEIVVTARQVILSVARLSKPKPSSSEEHIFETVATIPLREETGFWETGELHWVDNGVLSKHPDRKGKTYQVAQPVVR